MGLRRAAHVAWRKVGDETVLIHLRQKKIYTLNESGGFFWHSLDGSRELEEILAELGLEETAGADASTRLETFRRSLVQADLVESEEQAAGGKGGKEERAPLPRYPCGGFVPPELLWQQEVRNFGQSCAFISGANEACNTVPMS